MRRFLPAALAAVVLVASADVTAGASAGASAGATGVATGVAAAESAAVVDAETLYADAVAKAHDGDREAAASSLLAAIDAGYSSFFSLQYDAGLTPLRDDPAWAGVLDAFDRRNPWARDFRPLLDSDWSWPDYARARAGEPSLALPAEYEPVFAEYFGMHATFAADYAVSERVYPLRNTANFALDAGFVVPVPAMDAIVERSRGRRAVFLNESHGRSPTRAINFEIVRALRREGFDHLALEALAAVGSGGGCDGLRLEDADLAERGRVAAGVFGYPNDPIYAELIRVALEEGFEVVAYDHQRGAPSPAEREQAQARNLACVFRKAPEARLVVIGGFGHIFEDPAADPARHQMGYRFKGLTGIDPLSIDLTELLGLDETRLQTPDGAPAGTLPFGPYLLRNTSGAELALDGNDMVLFVPSVGGRGPWLELGGHRGAVTVDATGCPQGGCLAEARRVDEPADAITADRCIVPARATCDLYLPSGDYRIDLLGPEGTLIAQSRRTVAPTESAAPK